MEFHKRGEGILLQPREDPVQRGEVWRLGSEWLPCVCGMGNATSRVSGVAADKVGEISGGPVTKVLGCQAQAFRFYLQEM